MRKSTKKKIMSISIAVAFLASIITTALSFVIPTENQQDVWVARISIVIFNELQYIPAEVGVMNETREKLFTLNSDNIIYKVTDENVNLKDFFDIWGETFNSTCILDYCNNENHSMVMYVNNVLNTDYQYYVIQNMDDIIIDYR
jgi:hypothetical protein